MIPTTQPTPVDPGPATPAPTRAVTNYRTGINVFGLFRQYLSGVAPTHDPEQLLDLTDLSEAEFELPAGLEACTTIQAPFHPYPNKNSFLLGEWYWNGTQKSQENFQKLVGIVSSPDFRPADVRNVPWKQINTELATVSQSNTSGDPNLDGQRDEWLDENGGWTTRPVTISVPFHQRSANPGAKEYHVGDLHYRRLVPLIRHKISTTQAFHYEPFEIFWQPGPESTRTRVHGELYSSPVFVNAHQELQATPNEPGCILPRVVVALMIWSDATHLTSFGEAKLWPCYLQFGNESKYRRVKPSNHLFEHIAYLCSVRFTTCDMSTRY